MSADRTRAGGTDRAARQLLCFGQFFLKTNQRDSASHILHRPTVGRTHVTDTTSRRTEEDIDVATTGHLYSNHGTHLSTNKCDEHYSRSCVTCMRDPTRISKTTQQRYPRAWGFSSISHIRIRYSVNALPYETQEEHSLRRSPSSRERIRVRFTGQPPSLAEQLEPQHICESPPHK